MPVEIVDYKDTFRLMAKGHARALETAGETYILHTLDAWIDIHSKEMYDNIKTVRMSIPVPEIIILEHYNKMPNRFIKFSKENLLIRDGYECAYCGCELSLETSTIDHVVPRKNGGGTKWSNCISSCKRCNHTKGHSDPIGRFKPRYEPREPNHGSPLYNLKKKIRNLETPTSWNMFLFK